jgi:WD40 repeat protein
MRVLQGHESMGWSVAYSPDARYLLAGGHDGVRAWDLSSGGPPTVWPGLESSISRLAFLPGGEAVVLCSAFGTLEIRAFPGGQVLERHEPTRAGPVEGRAEAGLAREDRAIHVYHLCYRPVRRLAVGTYCIGMSVPLYVLAWHTGPPPRRVGLWGHSDFLPALDLSPSGALVASGSADRTVIVGDPVTGKRHLTWRAGGRVNMLHFLDDETLLAGVGFSLVLLDLKKGEPRWKFTAHRRPVVALAVSADRRTLVTAGDDRTVAVWSLETRRLRAQFDHEVWTDAHACVAVSPDGCTAAVAGKSGAVALIDLDV